MLNRVAENTSPVCNMQICSATVMRVYKQWLVMDFELLDSHRRECPSVERWKEGERERNGQWGLRECEELKSVYMEKGKRRCQLYRERSRH